MTLEEARGRERPRIRCDYQPEWRAIDLEVVSGDDWTVLTDLVTTEEVKNCQEMTAQLRIIKTKAPVFSARFFGNNLRGDTTGKTVFPPFLVFGPIWFCDMLPLI